MLELVLSTVSVGYPLYATIICIESNKNLLEWTIYWMSFSVIYWFHDYLNYFFQWIPLSWIVRFGTIVWLIHPKTKGGLFLYKCGFRLLCHHENWRINKEKYATELNDMTEKECSIFNTAQSYIEPWYDSIVYYKNKMSDKICLVVGIFNR